MNANITPKSPEEKNTNIIRQYIKQYNIDLFGIANLNEFKNNPGSIPTASYQILHNFNFAIVFGAQYGFLGKKAGGTEVSLFLEKIAFDLMLYLVEKEKKAALIVHTEDEIDPINRKGILPLKALASMAGIGWQSRSLLIVSPKYGPLHRLIAVITNMDLIADNPTENKCNDCFICIEKCPTKALKYSDFQYHPEEREDVLDISKCNGDNGCTICIILCPWIKRKIE